MSDLQDALDRVDDWLPDILDQREPARYKEWFMEAYASVAEAARKYANPDYEAAVRVDADWMGTNDPRGRILKARAMIAAALGVTEDE